jgi:hypothetical protein
MTKIINPDEFDAYEFSFSKWLPSGMKRYYGREHNQKMGFTNVYVDPKTDTWYAGNPGNSERPSRRVIAKPKYFETK